MEKVSKKKVVTVLVVLAFAFLFWKIYQERQYLFDTDWKFNPVSLFIMVILLILNYLSNIFAWHVLMKALGQKISLGKDFRIWALSTATRFLPGKIWQYPSRILMLSEAGVGVVVSGTAILAEVIFNLGFGALVVLVVGAGETVGLILFFLSLPIFFFILSNKHILKNLILIVRKITGKNLEVLNEVRFSYTFIPLVIISFLVRFIIPGTVLFYLVSALTPIDFSLLPNFIGAFSLSWLLGYISFFSPAGLGVAEVSLAAILGNYMAFGLASVVAVAFRLVNLLTEFILVAGIFFGDLRHRFNLKTPFFS